MSLLRGMIFCFAGPSGAGKTTLAEHLSLQANKIVTVTTRSPREGEVDGVDYFFWNQTQFNQAIHDGRFFEHQEVHGNFYGTLKDTLEETISKNRIATIILDVHGAMRLKNSYQNDVISIFVTTSVHKELERRLMQRNAPSEDLNRRLSAAIVELEFYNQNSLNFDHLVLTDESKQSWDTVQSIVVHESVRRGRIFSFSDLYE